MLEIYGCNPFFHFGVLYKDKNGNVILWGICVTQIPTNINLS